ncbi:MAG TPA: GNAT family N-acetyltransferase [Fimbriimonadaceae bacterium]|jgi:DNA-binding transcriptional MerR regulator|nr:GNAT family N-acetyltransferase [Fimbriimonadaceae bacterium]
MTELISAGEFLRRSGLTAKALRVYLDRGLLKPAATDPSSGYRLFSPDQVSDAVAILLLRGAGRSLGEIERFLSEPSCCAVEGWEQEVRSSAQGQLACLSEVRRRFGWDRSTGGAMAVTEIRSVRDESELEQLVSLLAGVHDMSSGDDRLDVLRQRFRDDGPLMAVAVEGVQIVGGGLAFRDDGGHATLRILGVTAGCRRRGVGRALVEHIEKEALNLGVERISLGADDDAVFWFRMGFTPMLLLQWAYDPSLFDAEAASLREGVLSGLESWESSFNGVPQLFVLLDEPRVDLRAAVREAVTGCHVGFCMTKPLVGAEVGG